MQNGLYYIGITFSLLMFSTQYIYAVNSLLYKFDNTFILGQSIYLFIFKRNLLKIEISQFYYGFGFLHLQFGFNPFKFIIPDGYF
jgi:hypothetical protein